jgi:hypothetical protein
MMLFLVRAITKKKKKSMAYKDVIMRTIRALFSKKTLALLQEGLMVDLR